MEMILLYILIYILLLFFISYRLSKNQEEEDFLIASRNRRGWQIMLTKFAASIGAGYFITYTGFAYEYGIGIFGMVLGMVAGFLLFAYWAAPRIAKNSREGKFYTIGHFVYSKTNSKLTRLLADVFSSAVLFSWLLVGIIGSAKIIELFSSISYSLAVVLITLLVVGYLLLAGYRAVITTDIFQSIIIFVLMAVVTWGVVRTNSIREIHTFTQVPLDLGVIGGFFLFGVLSVFSYSERYQLAYAAKDERGLKHGLGLSAIPILMITYFLLLIGVFMAKSAPGLDVGLVFTESLRLFLPEMFLPLAVVLFFAGIMSSADTNLYAIASHYAFNRKGNPIIHTKKAIVVLGFVLILLSIMFPDVVSVSIFAGALALTLSMGMVYIIAGGKSSSRFLGSITFAVIALILGIGFFGLIPAVAILVILGGVVGLCVPLNLRWKK